MPLQYLTNNSGETIAVQIPIAEWNAIVDKHGDIQELNTWQKTFIDSRLTEYKNHPESLMGMEEFEKLLNADENI